MGEHKGMPPNLLEARMKAVGQRESMFEPRGILSSGAFFQPLRFPITQERRVGDGRKNHHPEKGF
jgi:hypothetical protein